jgi:hypothetical protein
MTVRLEVADPNGGASIRRCGFLRASGTGTCRYVIGLGCPGRPRTCLFPTRCSVRPPDLLVAVCSSRPLQSQPVESTAMSDIARALIDYGRLDTVRRNPPGAIELAGRHRAPWSRRSRCRCACRECDEGITRVRTRPIVGCGCAQRRSQRSVVTPRRLWVSSQRIC